VIADHIHVIADHIQRHRGSHSRDHRSRSTPSPVVCTRSDDVFLRRPITLHVIADRMRATGRHIHTMGHPTHAIADLTHARRPHVQRDHRSRACDRRSHSSDETTTRTRSLISRTRTSSEWTGDPTGGGDRECEAKRKACLALAGLSSLTAAAVHRVGSKPPSGGARSLAPAFRRGKRPPPIRARVAGDRKAFPKMPLDVKSVARYTRARSRGGDRSPA